MCRKKDAERNEGTVSAPQTQIPGTCVPVSVFYLHVHVHVHTNVHDKQSRQRYTLHVHTCSVGNQLSTSFCTSRKTHASDG